MTPAAWYGLIICVVSVIAAYRIGFSAGFEAGRDAGIQDGRKEGVKEGSKRGYAVGFDRGRRRSEETNSDGDRDGGWGLGRVAVGIIGLVLALLVISSLNPNSPDPIDANKEATFQRTYSPAPSDRSEWNAEPSTKVRDNRLPGEPSVERSIPPMR